VNPPFARRLPAALAFLLLAFAGCAPPPRPGIELSAGRREERYLSALGQREKRGGSVERQIVFRSRLGDQQRFPAMQASLELAAPDAPVNWSLFSSTIPSSAIVASSSDTVLLEAQALLMARKAAIVNCELISPAVSTSCPDAPTSRSLPSPPMRKSFPDAPVI